MIYPCSEAHAVFAATATRRPHGYFALGTYWAAMPVQTSYLHNRKVALEQAKLGGVESFLPWYERVWLVAQRATKALREWLWHTIS